MISFKSKIFALAVLWSSFLQAAEPTVLRIYTAVEIDELQSYKKAFEKKYPEIKIEWVRNSTGVVAAQLWAEKDNPQADLIWGLASTSFNSLLKQKNYFLPYSPAQLDKIKMDFRDSQTPPRWVGLRGWLAAICVNKIEMEKKKLALPQTWADLTKPTYKNEMVMPHPLSSGTGFFYVGGWLKTHKEPWKYMKDLHQNMRSYVHSGSKPCQMAAQGEVPMGLSFSSRGQKLISKGAPLEMIYPKDGLGWDIEVMALVQKSKNIESAKKFMDWALSDEAFELYKVGSDFTARKLSDSSSPQLSLMIPNQLSWMSENRNKILAQWKAQFDEKSESRKE